MMSLNAPLLRASFDLVIERDPELVKHFYDHLFKINPELAPMFHRRPREAQEEMLAGALVAVLDHLDDAPWLVNQLGSLGEKHIGYGVTPAMYDAVGASLLATLARAAGDDWNDELLEAWADAYGAITDLMLAGTLARASA